MVSRRHVITGSVAAGLTAALAAPVRAASGVEQQWSIETVSRFGEAYEGQGNLFASVIDPLVSPIASNAQQATLIQSQMDPAIGFFDVDPGDIDKLLDEVPEGYAALRGIAGYSVDGERRLMGVMDVANAGASGGTVASRVAETAEQYQASVTRASRTGLEPVWVQVDNLDGAPRFHTLYRQSTGAWQARHVVKPQDLTALTTSMTGQGFRVARMAPYYDGGALRFAVLFRPSRNLGWQARFGLQSPREFDFDLRPKGYSLLQAIRYQDGAGQRWACIWQNQTGVKPNLFWGV